MVSIVLVLYTKRNKVTRAEVVEIYPDACMCMCTTSGSKITHGLVVSKELVVFPR